MNSKKTFIFFITRHTVYIYCKTHSFSNFVLCCLSQRLLCLLYALFVVGWKWRWLDKSALVAARSGKRVPTSPGGYALKAAVGVLHTTHTPLRRNSNPFYLHKKSRSQIEQSLIRIGSSCLPPAGEPAGPVRRAGIYASPPNTLSSTSAHIYAIRFPKGKTN